MCTSETLLLPPLQLPATLLCCLLFAFPTTKTCCSSTHFHPINTKWQETEAATTSSSSAISPLYLQPSSPLCSSVAFPQLTPSDFCEIRFGSAFRSSSVAFVRCPISQGMQKPVLTSSLQLKQLATSAAFSRTTATPHLAPISFNLCSSCSAQLFSQPAST